MKSTINALVAGSTILAELKLKLESHANAAPAWRAAAAQGMEVAEIVAALDAEREIVAGALLQPLLGQGQLEEAAAAATFGEPVARFA